MADSPYRSVVVGTDGSPTAELAVRKAARIARENSATLHIVSGYDPVEARVAATGAGRDAAAWAIPPDAHVARVLDEAAAAVRTDGLDLETHACRSDGADAILEVAEAEDADLIVVGSRGMTGSRRFLLGSVPNKVSHHARCDVLIVQTG